VKFEGNDAADAECAGERSRDVGRVRCARRDPGNLQESR
jgi:hypothetical protein